MKHNNNNDNNIRQKTTNIPDLEIIDLDKDSLDNLNDLPDVLPDAYESADDPDEDDMLEEDLNSSEPDSSPTSRNFKEDLSWATEDWADDDTEEDSYDEEDASQKHSNKLSMLIHIGFAVIVVLIVFLAVQRIRNFGNVQNLADYEGRMDAEVLDSILPLIPVNGVEPVDDGKTTIVAFGNAPFADDRDSEDSLAGIIEDMTGATVYNCSVANSYLAAEHPSLQVETALTDAFNFYWLTTTFCVRNNDHLYQEIFEELGDDIPAGGLEAYQTLTTLDFNEVDVIVLMYDGSDYLAGHNMYSDENDTDIQQFTGNMCAGIDLIKATYPHIRIIVMSPTYAFAVDDEGKYISSDQYIYNDQDVLSTYVIKQFGYAYDREVTFVDNLYGTITEDNAEEYLTDNIHLNVEGRKKVAERFVYALNYYDEAE